ncbi:unnamed protein product [Alternaria alternata]
MRQIDMEELMAFIREDLGSMLNDKHDVYSPGSLESLPCELIVMIAEYLSKKDLLTLRSLGNRNISRGIDDRFVKVCFSRRRCRTTMASVARLEALSCTRLAERIRTLEVYTIFDCQPSRFGDLATGKPCAKAAISTSEVPWMFGRIFQRLTNLKNFLFRAPPGLWGMCDEELTNELPLFGFSEAHPHLSPPFRLRSLELDGLVTSTSAPTLARIINVHSSSIRRVVLKHTNFHYPNTLREFFTACANSGIHYYRSESLLFHETSMLVGTSLSFRVFEDKEDELHRDWSGEEDLDQCDLLDTTCQDWVEVRFPSGRDILVYDNENGQNGDDWMYRAFMAGVSMIKDGALIDS